jgi:hypothetical protein
VMQNRFTVIPIDHLARKGILHWYCHRSVNRGNYRYVKYPVKLKSQRATRV